MRCTKNVEGAVTISDIRTRLYKNQYYNGRLIVNYNWIIIAVITSLFSSSLHNCLHHCMQYSESTVPLLVLLTQVYGRYNHSLKLTPSQWISLRQCQGFNYKIHQT